MSEPDNLQVDSLDQFVKILTVWHMERCAQVKHLLEVPDGTSFTVGDPIDEEEIILTGDSLKAFKLGIEMVLMQLGTLPFVAEVEDETAPA